MALSRIEQHTLHLCQTSLITVDLGIVEDDERRPAGLLQQIGIGQPADQAHLFACTKAQGCNIPTLCRAVDLTQ
ncbi:hypothetical protein SAMN05216214_10896 [Atopomonas hussainii]|uniref:Uncharacterized protein n=1 Tax=Atopomonas hussainii TaxID=1429083 RepID=A0A1H7MJB7_9GAMM|nr:hypothetical protein SAMN05216214_10896 [Atopomonas hussainii]